MRHTTLERRTWLSIATLALSAFGWQSCQAVPVAVFTDTFNTSANSSDVNFEINTARQSGILAPISYVDNAGNAGNDYHTQVNTSLTPNQLLVFGDSSLVQPMVSPNYSFTGSSPSGTVGKQITVSFNVGNSGAAIANSYLEAGLTIGATAPLTTIGSAAPNFGLRFVEDTFGATPFGNFMQVYDGSTLIGNLINHGRGTSRIDLRLNINDLSDGNPWDGVGSTTIDVFVNNVAVFNFTKGSGGYTSNYLTMMASANGVALAAQAHNFDNLVVFAEAVPEISSFVGGSTVAVLVGLGWMHKRRQAVAQA